MIRNTLSFVASSLLVTLIISTALLVDVRPAGAIVGCQIPPPTLSEQLKASRATAIVRLVRYPPYRPLDSSHGAQCTFEVVEILKGDAEFLRHFIRNSPYRIDMTYRGDAPLGTELLAFCRRADYSSWTTSLAINDATREYLRRLATLLSDGSRRAAFFLSYREHPDPVLASDAFAELEKTTFADFRAVKEKLSPPELRSVIDNPFAAYAECRLSLRMLAACGRDEDVRMLEDRIKNGAPGSVDFESVTGCYLALKGAAGMPLVEERFFKNPAADDSLNYSVAMALRYIGNQTDAVPHHRLAQSLRLLLDRRDLACYVVSDLADWQDWSAMPRLVQLFKTSDADNSTRVAVIDFLRVCPLPEAKTHLDELGRLHPEALGGVESYPSDPQ